MCSFPVWLCVIWRLWVICGLGIPFALVCVCSWPVCLVISVWLGFVCFLVVTCYWFVSCWFIRYFGVILSFVALQVAPFRVVSYLPPWFLCGVATLWVLLLGGFVYGT